MKPLVIETKLAPTPKNAPKYAVTIKNALGKDVVIADPTANRALVALMDMFAVVGGAASHWGGPSAFAEIIASIHAIMFNNAEQKQWYQSYNFVNDAGHAENGIYALRANYGFDGLTIDDLMKFRSFNTKLTGHGESHVNPEGIYLSNGPLGSSLPQAQGLAMADKLAGNDRVTFCVVSDGACMEGEAKEALAAIPGFAGKGRMNPFVMVLSDNNTKLSGRIDADSYSMQPTFNALSTLGWNIIKVENGNDLTAVYQAIEKALATAKANPSAPVCVWCKTVKGYGVAATVKSASGGHGFPLKTPETIEAFVAEIYGGAANVPAELAQYAATLRTQWEAKQAAKTTTPAVASAPKSKIQAGLAKGAIRAAKEGVPVYSVCCDVQGSTGISAFQKEFPDSFVEVGISESNMISVAAGFSKIGYVPVVDAFGQFGITKGNLPITMANLSQAPIVAIFSHIGLQDAADGASHQATTYFAAVSAIPNTVVVAPSCSEEADALMYQALTRMKAAREANKETESIIFFVGRENYPTSWSSDSKYQWGKAAVLHKPAETFAKNVAIIICGPLVGYALKAAAELESQGIGAYVINNPFVNKVDIDTIAPIMEACKGQVITDEDHQILGGMGSMLAHALATNGIVCKMKSLGIRGEFGRSAYKVEELYKAQKMYTDDIILAAKSF